jgi:hypothetical protein
MKRRTEKILTAILSGLGIAGVAYGMSERNHPAFIFGLLMVIAAYLRIRRELKASLKKKSEDGGKG